MIGDVVYFATRRYIVAGVVDDQIALKRYSKHHREWLYKIEPRYIFEALYTKTPLKWR